MKIQSSHVSLRALRTFCVAARNLSFTLAADVLFVTPSAVSHQIKSLEDELGIALFERGNRTLSLTDAGQALFDEVDPLISKINEVTARFKKQKIRHTMRVSVQPFFASELFVPRLAEFIARHPEIDMHIDSSDESPEKHPASTDVSIRVFSKAPPNLAAEAFFPLRIVPACSKALRRKILTASKKKDEHFPIILHSRRSGLWQTWSDSSGIQLPQPTSTIQLDSTLAVVQAAEKGVGVAMVPVPASNRLFASGKLVKLYEHEAATPERYYFVSSKEDAKKPPVQALRNWVLNTFAELS